MNRFGFLAALALAVSSQGSPFYTGQAARAVLGQSSFSSHEAGVSGTALTVLKGKLYVADSSGKLLTFDLSQIPAPAAEVTSGSNSCKVCGFLPTASIQQTVIPGGATISTWDRSLAAIDSGGHRVLFWRDVTAPSAYVKPDIVLQAGASGISDPVSVALDGGRLFVGDATLHSVLVWNSLPEQDNQHADALLGNFNSDSPAGADTIDRPDALASDGTNLYVSDLQARRILVFTPGDFHLHPEGLTNSATLLPGALAGGTLVSISGPGLSEVAASAVDDGSEPLPLKLGGVQVIFNGAPAPLISVTPDQIQAQLPYTSADVTAANLYVRTERASGDITTSNAIPVTLAPAAPGLFALAGDEPRPGIAADDAGPVSSEQPATAGQAIKLWVTGLHVRSESKVSAGQPFASAAIDVDPVSATVNGEPAEVVQVVLPPTSIGVYEVTVRLPSVSYPGGTAEISLTEDAITSNTVAVSVAH